MKKICIVKKNQEIQNIISKGKKLISKLMIVYYISNNENYSRFCISVGKKIGKAYKRNYYKRVTKNIIDKLNFKNNNDYVIILRNAICDKKFEEIFDEFKKVFKGEINEK